jgi:hypothetical protein
MLLLVADALALYRLKPLTGVHAHQGTRLTERGIFADALFRRQAD